MEILELIKSLGYEPIDRMDKVAKLWKQFYEGYVEDFHRYNDYQGTSTGIVKRERKSLRMAKTLSEIWADNIINPETEFIISSSKEKSSKQEWLDNYFNEYGVKERLNDLMEVTFALGIGATTQYKDNKGRVINQYVTREFIYPLKETNGEIVSCAFASIDGDGTVFIQIHESIDSGYLIYNLFFDKNGARLYPENAPIEVMKSDVKLFQLYNPGIANNIDIGNPIGISIYGNAVDELKSVDIVYDALDKEVRNGRMRVYVKGEALVNDMGEQRPLFNKDQDEFFLLPEDDATDGKTLIVVQAPTLRVEQLINTLNKQLNLLGSKCGLGDNAFYSDAGTIYTNTDQVISTNSKFYKTRTKHATRLSTPLKQMIQAIHYMQFGSILEDDVIIEFDDSIIHDKDAEYNRTLQMYNAGLIDRVEFYIRAFGMSEKEAIDYNNKITKRMALTEDVEEEGDDAG